VCKHIGDARANVKRADDVHACLRAARVSFDARGNGHQDHPRCARSCTVADCWLGAEVTDDAAGDSLQLSEYESEK